MSCTRKRKVFTSSGSWNFKTVVQSRSGWNLLQNSVKDKVFHFAPHRPKYIHSQAANDYKEKHVTSPLEIPCIPQYLMMHSIGKWSQCVLLLAESNSEKTFNPHLPPLPPPPPKQSLSCTSSDARFDGCIVVKWCKICKDNISHCSQPFPLKSLCPPSSC